MSTGRDSRVRSEAQLSRKRLVDRVKHKENRHKSKGQLERIEAEILQIRQSLEQITLQLGNTGLPHNLVHHILPPGISTIHNQQWTADFPTQLTIPSPLMPTQTQPTTLPSIRVLDCRCGFKHSDHFDSLERCSVTNLYQANVAFPHSLQTTNNMPRNPPLPSMMLHSDGDNFVTSLITPFLRDMKADGPIETLLGAYLFAYRLMRVCCVYNTSGSTNLR